MTDALALARQYAVQGAGDVENQWLLVREAISTALEPLESKLFALARPKPVSVAQLALEQARRAARECVVCGRPLDTGDGSACFICGDSAAAGLRRRQQDEAALRAEINTFKHAVEDAWFTTMPVGLFRALAGRVPDAPYVEVVSDVAADAWARFLDNECRDRHRTYSLGRIPARVCGGCYMPLKSVLDPIVDRETVVCGPTCAARIDLLEDTDYGAQCQWCNRWFRWDIPENAPVTVPYCSPHCFWAGPEDPLDPGVPHPWPATLYLPAPPTTPSARTKHGWPQVVATVTWEANSGSRPPGWMAKGLSPAPVPVIVETGAVALGPEGLTEEVLLAALPGTAQGLAERLGVSYGQVRGRLFKLQARGLIRRSEITDSGSQGGRPEVIWVKTDD